MKQRLFYAGVMVGVGICAVPTCWMYREYNKVQSTMTGTRENCRALTALLGAQQVVIENLEEKQPLEKIPIWNTHHRYIPSTYKPSPTIID